VSRDYELGFILQPEVNEEQTRTILERIEQIVSTYGGQIMRVNQWGRKRLSYPIEHNRDGFYVFIDMILTPETVSELDRTLKVSEEVLRHLIKRRDPKTVQKEREARANAAAQAQANPEPKEQGEDAVDAVGEPDASGEEAASAISEVEVPTETENELESILTPEEDQFVPQAIEEEAVEA